MLFLEAQWKLIFLKIKMSKKLQTKHEKYNKVILYCWRNIRPSGCYITWNNEDMSTGKRNLSSICILRKFTFSAFFPFAITTAAWRNIREDFRTHTHQFFSNQSRRPLQFHVFKPNTRKVKLPQLFFYSSIPGKNCIRSLASAFAF